jgi:trans-aconitate methyltransferase
MTHYAIHGGVAGSKRMEVVARAYWPTTLPLLQRAGIREGMHCLDLGCGAGDVTFEIARLVGPSGRVVGMDMDLVKLDADIGPKLLAMLAAAGTQQLNLSIVDPEQEHGSGKDISLLTLIGISEAVLAEKLTQESELRELLSELESYTRDPLSIICGPRVFQVWGRRAPA